MNDMDPITEAAETAAEAVDTAGASDKPDWELPTMEDVSEEVMAQPYIRFT